MFKTFRKAESVNFMLIRDNLKILKDYCFFEKIKIKMGTQTCRKNRKKLLIAKNQYKSGLSLYILSDTFKMTGPPFYCIIFECSKSF